MEEENVAVTVVARGSFEHVSVGTAFTVYGPVPVDVGAAAEPDFDFEAASLAAATIADTRGARLSELGIATEALDAAFTESEKMLIKSTKSKE